MKQITIKKLRPRFGVAQPIERRGRLGVFTICIDDELPPEQNYLNITGQEKFERTRLKAVKQVKSVFSGVEITGTVNSIIEILINNDKIIANLSNIRTFDDYTFKHSVNVCVLALMTGIVMNFNRLKLLSLGTAALLHDMGKVFVSKSILRKPGKLSEKEFSKVKKHTFYGYHYLFNSVDHACAVTALQHHERCNGEGYPSGLKGSEINEFARIVGVADVYDALTADRVYRKAYPAHEAYKIITESENTLFDNNVVQSFLRNITAGTVVKNDKESAVS